MSSASRARRTAAVVEIAVDWAFDVCGRALCRFSCSLSLYLDADLRRIAFRFHDL
jgi:hypothetical protein